MGKKKKIKKVKKRAVVKTTVQGINRVELCEFLTANKPVINVVSKIACVSWSEPSV